MGLRDAFSALIGGRRDDFHTVEWLGPSFREMVLGLTPEELYRTQPHLRIVLSFVARNVAHLGLKAYARESESDRVRLREDPIALLLRRPNSSMTGFELLESLASDLGLYDIAYWYVYEDLDAPSGWVIQPIPPSWVVEQRGGTFFEAARYVVQNPDGTRSMVEADDMLVFHGWNPGRPKQGTSPVATLKQVLAEQVQAWSYREQVWRNAGRVGAVITRPKDAGWSDDARARFMAAWKARWTGMDGSRAGGTPILEDGMTINRLGFNAREEEWAEVSKIALSTVAAVYHVNPVMVGILDNANFSNTKEFRKMLYSETLGPQLARIEDRLNAFLVPRVTSTPGAYVEFNIEEKLQGDFEEQAAILSTSAGRPWMSANEVRALRNLPAIEGGDDLVIPLNVLVGGQASPRDSGTQNRSAAPAPRAKAIARTALRGKEQAPTSYEKKTEEVVRAFFERQRKSVLSELGAKDPDWWDEDRWDRELADDLFAVAMAVTVNVSAAVLESVGFGPDEYDTARTEAFLRAVAKSRAGAINSTTRDQITAILAGRGPEGVEDPAHVFDVASGDRAAVIAGTVVTTLAAFATVEAVRQNSASGTKTWVVTSSAPRSEHAAMNGETVGIDEKFSNGADWPGDPVLGADGVANCMCDVEVRWG
ncbi:phage portal protein [Microbacterium aurantiacum]|uniref:phage portal protein n=1 Tax=Microbacterium aurantiacum TaxID=162393 RepID=UPI003420721C